MVLNILMSVAQWEREAIAERTRDALRHKRSKGERTGTIPRGWGLDADGRTLVPDPVEVEDIAQILALAEAGAGSRAIARMLSPDRRERWPESTIRSILKRPRS
jgi:DNA invertase Pin-like site-specific DNA recombinase